MKLLRWIARNAIEILIALVIIGIIMAIALPNIWEMNRLKNQTEVIEVMQALAQKCKDPTQACANNTITVRGYTIQLQNKSGGRIEITATPVNNDPKAVWGRTGKNSFYIDEREVLFAREYGMPPIREETTGPLVNKVIQWKK